MIAILTFYFPFGVAMSLQNFPDNVLYEMDNLLVLRGINSETIDLIATDPPFNTKRNRAGTAGFYVDNWKYGNESILPDQWKWNEVHPKWRDSIQDGYPQLYQVIETTRLVQGEDTAAFLCFMSVRLLEMQRILKPTGSIFLHCDHTVNSYLRIVMDAIFGKKNFRNEVVWSYGGPRAIKTAFPRKHDTIFFYSKTKSYTFNEQRDELPAYLYERARKDKDGRLWVDQNLGNLTKETISRMKKEGRVFVTKKGNLRRKQYLDEMRGGQINDVWDIPIINSQSKERTGSPDQKPLALYERIIKASSNEGDLVLDPFCGCATTIIAANNLNRRWIGVDRRPDARIHIVTRLYFSEQDRINKNQGKKPIPKKERERIKKQAEEYSGWLDKQTARYEMHYQTKPPIRTDNGEQSIAELPSVYSAEPENPHTRDEMKEILISQFGVECWGCGFQPPDDDDRYLHLDHINPKSAGGLNTIDNRSILCQPCNSTKSDTMTLVGLRKQNKREKRLKKTELELIDIPATVKWTSQYLIEHRKKNPEQRKLDF